MADVPHRYNIQTDEMVVVDQEWVDKVEALFTSFGAARRAARSVIEIREGLVLAPPPELQAFLDAWQPEFPDRIEQVIKQARND